MENKSRGPMLRVVFWFCLGCLYGVIAIAGIWRDLRGSHPPAGLWHMAVDFLVWPGLAIVCFAYYRRELTALKAAR